MFEGEYFSFHFIIEMVVFFAISWILVAGLKSFRYIRSQLDYEKKRNDMFSVVLTDTINSQFAEWNMTRSEKEISWLMLKGFRFSEIARLRGVKETTARLQATTAYRKAGVIGRSEFCAEIIQPLLSSLPKDVPESEEKI